MRARFFLAFAARAPLFVVAAASLMACNPPPPRVADAGVPPGLVAQMLVAPATSAVGFALAGGDRAWMVWTELREEHEGVVLAAQRQGAEWTEPITLTTSAVIARPGAVPAAIAPAGGKLLALYASSTADGHGADLSSIEQGGKRVIVERDLGTRHEGRISLVERNDGGIDAIWLREVVGPLDRQRATSVVFSSRESDGRFGARRPLDPNVCERGSLGAAATSQGVVFAWRSVSTWREMDIAAAILLEGQLRRPEGLARDGWRPRDCPEDGAVAAGSGRRAFIAWFTGANAARVKVATSLDGGRSFGGTLRADSGSPDGSVEIAMLGSDEALVTWHEAGAMFARIIDANERLGGPLRVGDAPGFAMTPAIAKDGDGILLAWRDRAGIKIARITRAR